MNIAIPVNEDEKTVCVSFGRTPEFLILNTETNERQFINNDAATASGGAGIQAAQLMVDKDIQILLTPRCGENAAKVLNEASIKMYKTTSQNLEDEIKKYLSGKLKPLTEIHSGFHNPEFAN